MQTSQRCNQCGKIQERMFNLQSLDRPDVDGVKDSLKDMQVQDLICAGEAQADIAKLIKTFPQGGAVTYRWETTPRGPVVIISPVPKKTHAAANASAEAKTKAQLMEEAVMLGVTFERAWPKERIAEVIAAHKANVSEMAGA